MNICFYKYELYIYVLYKNILINIKKYNEYVKDLDIKKCIKDMKNIYTKNYFIKKVLIIISKIENRKCIYIDDNVLKSIFDIIFKYMFDVDLCIISINNMAHIQYEISKDCEWSLKTSYESI